MYFDSFSDLIHMDGHGVYVWVSYGIFAAVFILNIVAARSSRKQLIARAKRAIQRSEMNASSAVDISDSAS